MEHNNPVDYDTPNSLAAIWSMMLPGLGQMMKGRIMPGLIWSFLVAGGYFTFFWPGLIFHGLCILDAAFYKGEWQLRVPYLLLVAALLYYIIARNGL